MCNGSGQGDTGGPLPTGIPHIFHVSLCNSMTIQEPLQSASSIMKIKQKRWRCQAWIRIWQPAETLWSHLGCKYLWSESTSTLSIVSSLNMCCIVLWHKDMAIFFHRTHSWIIVPITCLWPLSLWFVSGIVLDLGCGFLMKLMPPRNYLIFLTFLGVAFLRMASILFRVGW